MAWKFQRGGQSGLADELLRSLFGGRAYRGPERRTEWKKEWKCPTCGLNNWDIRQVCRGCKCKKGAPKAPLAKVVGGGSQKPQALAPWATAGMVGERVGRLEVAIQAAKASGGCDKAIQSLETELEQQNKKAEESHSILQLVESTNAFIIRAEKRQSGLSDQIAALQEQWRVNEGELREARKRLADMEVKAVK